MSSRCILVNFHLYTPFGKIYYQPMLDFFLKQMREFQDEYDHLYLLDSNWEIDPKEIEGMKATIIRTSPQMRYYDCYRQVIPLIKEDLVFFLDNDSVIWEEGIIKKVFDLLDFSLPVHDTAFGDESHQDVVTIIDEIGEYKTDKLKNGNKFTPYWFATRKELLMKYLDVEWGDHMPHSETFGLLTEAMLNDDVKVYEWPETKDSIYFDGHKDGEKQAHQGYYSHIRGGSSIPYLLASKNDTPEHNQQYWDYLKNQPRSEILRHAMWFWWMTTETGNVEVGREITEMLNDMGVSPDEWTEYFKRFQEYHGL